MLGFQEALASSVNATLPIGQQVAVVCLPMLAVLKVLAWTERRTREPGKDASDLMLILSNYLDAGQGERLSVEANALFGLGDFDYERAGAWLVGKDASALLHAHSQNLNRIEEAVRSALEPEIDPDGPLRLIPDLRHTDPERARRLVVSFLAGFNGEHYI